MKSQVNFTFLQLPCNAHGGISTTATCVWRFHSQLARGRQQYYDYLTSKTA